MIFIQPQDNSGRTLKECELFAYAANTLTELPIFTDCTYTAPYPHPIVADGGGRLPQLCFGPWVYDLLLRGGDPCNCTELNYYSFSTPCQATRTAIADGPTVIYDFDLLHPLFQDDTTTIMTIDTMMDGADSVADKTVVSVVKSGGAFALGTPAVVYNDGGTASVTLADGASLQIGVDGTGEATQVISFTASQRPFTVL